MGLLSSISYLKSSPMIKYTKTTLDKLEAIFDEINYIIRYEKGNFNAGYCLVDNKKVAVINKFYDTEARITCLIDILGQINIEDTALAEANAEFYQKIMQNVEKKRE
jgi:hypothetical protein